MTSPTHVAGGIIAAQLLSHHLQLQEPQWVLIIVAAVGSILPDIDLPGSLMSSVIKPISVCYNWLEERLMPRGMQHRGASHTLMCVLLMLGIAYWDALSTIYTQMLAHTHYQGLLWSPNSYMLALTAGLVSHIILDMLTTSGVPLLYPFVRTRLRVCNIKTGSAAEEYTRNLLWVVILVLTVYQR